MGGRQTATTSLIVAPERVTGQVSARGRTALSSVRWTLTVIPLAVGTIQGETMKYVVANASGRILKPDASRASEAINWARNRIQGESSVHKVPEIIRVSGDDPDEVLLVADEETAKIDGWWKGRSGSVGRTGV